MKRIFTIIGALIRSVWRLISFLRQFILNFIFLGIFGVIALAFLERDERPLLQEKSALLLDLNGPIVEQKSPINPLEDVTSSALRQPPIRQNVLFDIVKTIRHAATDPQVSGLVLKLDDMKETNLTKLRYIAKAINEFKATDKPVYAVGDRYSQSQYYLASYADKVFMSPDGALLLTGYGAYSLYYQSLLKNLDVNTHVFRVGTYKSAVEPYLQNQMSEEAKQANTQWLNQLWAAYSQDVAHNRNIDATILTPNMDELLVQLKAVQGNFAQLNKNMGLVDTLATRPEIRQQLIRLFGENTQTQTFNHIGYYDYKSTLSPESSSSGNQIAVIVADGAIIDGAQRPNTVGGDTVATLLKKARLDDNIKAVILRVDSPGGSAFASEVIRNEIEALQETGKPIVASMSSLAASGGYWISVTADKIIAQPTTLTGSIGIFAVFATLEKGLEKLGIHTDGVGTTPFSGLGVTRQLPEQVSDVFQLGIEHGYQRFIGLVSRYRHLSLEKADTIGQGRIWTGQDALQLGLIDQLGDFDDAVVQAAQLAKLESHQLKWLTLPQHPMELLLQEFSANIKNNLITNVLGLESETITTLGKTLTQDAAPLLNFNDPKGQYAFCLNCSNQ